MDNEKYEKYPERNSLQLEPLLSTRLLVADEA